MKQSMKQFELKQIIASIRIALSGFKKGAVTAGRYLQSQIALSTSPLAAELKKRKPVYKKPVIEKKSDSRKERVVYAIKLVSLHIASAIAFFLKSLALVGYLLLGRYIPPFWFSLLVQTPLNLAKNVYRSTAQLRTKYRREYRAVQALLGVLVLLYGGRVVYHWNSITIDVVAPGPTQVDLGYPPEKLYLDFSEPAANLTSLSHELSEQITIKPAIKGEWRWNGESQIVFSPGEEWRVGEEYKVTLDSSLIRTGKTLSSDTVYFQSAKFVAEISSFQLYMDPYRPEEIKMVGTVKFSHPVNREAFKENATISIGDDGSFLSKDLKSDISFNATGTEAYLHSETITITSKKQSADLVIRSGVTAMRGGTGLDSKLTSKDEIPDMESFFHIEEMSVSIVENEKSESEQVLVVETTAPVRSSQLEAKIKAYLLPVDRKMGETLPVEKNFSWFDAGQINASVIEQSTAVELKALPTELDYTKLHSFRVDLPVNRHLFVTIPSGIKAAGNFTLVKPFKKVIQIPEFPKEIKIAGNGSVLSLAGEKKLTLLARDVRAIYCEIGKIKPSDIAHLVTQAYSYSYEMKNPKFSEYADFGEDNILKRFSRVIPLSPVPPGKVQYSSLDFSTLLGGEVRNGLFMLKLREYDPVKKEAGKIYDQRLVMITDLGIILKQGADRSSDVFIQSILSGHPVGGARIDVLGRNGLAVFNGYSDETGTVHIPSLEGLQREKYPVVLTVALGEDLSFIPLTSSDRSIELSRFDTGGEYTTGGDDALKASIFSERGIYRPGETVHLGIIVRKGDLNLAAPGIPLEAVITDARDAAILTKRFSLSADGIHELSFDTNLASPTGGYQAKIFTVKRNGKRGLIGYASFSVEEFVPDTMKLSVHIDGEESPGWISPENIKAQISLWNLFGTPAAKHTISSHVSISPALPAFRGFGGYTFHDPLKTKSGLSEKLAPKKTDENGNAQIAIHLDTLEKGSYRLSYVSEATAPDSGRTIRAAKSVTVSPLKKILGFKPTGDLEYIHQNAESPVHIIALNNRLKRIRADALKGELKEIKYISALTRQNDGTYRYQSVKKEIPVRSFPFVVPAEGLYYTPPSNAAGEFQFTIHDSADDTELLSFSYYVAGPGETVSRMDKDSELQVKLNKKDYSPGETIEISIRSPYKGAGIITIERDRVYAHKWFKTDTQNSIQYITVPQNLAVNAYVNVSFTRALDSKEIYLNPLSSGIAPFSINKDLRRNRIELSTPKLVRPGETLKIGYKTSHAGKIVVFAVDEGILQVARYTTPSPLDFFMQKRALQVTTRQIMDLILPEYSVVRLLSHPGGGMGDALASAGLNPFRSRRLKPVVFWSGIRNASPEGGVVSYRVPEYFNGTLRVMAVAVSDTTMGSASQQTTVRGDFVITPTLPPVVAPGDEFEISVNVANNVKGSGASPSIAVSLDVTGPVKLLSSAKTTTKIAENGQGAVSFQFKAAGTSGEATIKLHAGYGEKGASYTETMSVRPAVAYSKKIESGFLASDPIHIAFDKPFLPKFHKKEAFVSALPLGLASGLIAFLNDYPHGCTEQIVSQSLPHLVFRNRPEFFDNTGDTQKKIEFALKILKERQNGDGGFGYWYPGDTADPFITIYAVHFLTDLKETGYPVDGELFSRGLKHLNDIASAPVTNRDELAYAAYAAYLLTRDGVITGSYLDTYEEFIKENGEKDDIAIAYIAASRALLKQQNRANDLIRKVEFKNIKSDYNRYNDSLVRNSQLLYLLGRHFPEEARRFEDENLKLYLEPILSGEFNTIGSAYALLALNSFTSGEHPFAADQFQILAFGKEGALQPKSSARGLLLKSSLPVSATKAQIVPPKGGGGFYQFVESGFEKEIPTKTKNDGIEVYREYLDESGSSVDSAQVGELITVNVMLRSTDKQIHRRIAITDLLPGGFQTEISSVRDEEGTSNFPEYVDRREDRLLIYGEAGDEVKIFSYKMRAMNKGKFLLPPVYAESMYDKSVHSHSSSDHFEITAP